MNEPTTDSNVSFDGEGYLTDLSQWTRDIALKIAAEEGIEMSEAHWEVINFIQECHRDGKPLSIRMFKKQGPVSIKELYDLFPGGPLKKSTRIAGIPKPASCI